MAKKQVRYGSANIQKARLAPITEQHIAEICDATGENKNECIQTALAERYMRIVYRQMEDKVEELHAYVLKLEAELRDAVN